MEHDKKEQQMTEQPDTAGTDEQEKPQQPVNWPLPTNVTEYLLSFRTNPDDIQKELKHMGNVRQVCRFFAQEGKRPQVKLWLRKQQQEILDLLTCLKH